MPDSEHRPPAEVIRLRAIELLSVAQIGLAYVRDPFDRQRYEQVREVGRSLMELVSRADLTTLRKVVEVDTGYATPKLDTRGADFDHDHRILLVQDRSGVVVEATKLVAVLDRESTGATAGSCTTIT